MPETIPQRWNYQVVVHRCNKRLDRLIDIAGIIWNHALALQRRYHRLTGRYISKYDMKAHLRKLRAGSPRFQYWQNVNSQALADICGRLEQAYEPYRKGAAKKPPKFRKVKQYKSFTLPIGNGCKLIESDNSKIGKLRLAFGWRGAEKMTVKYHIGGRPLPDKVNSVVIKRTGDGKFWLSFVVEAELTQTDYPSTGEVAGLDYMLQYLFMTDDGEIIDSPRFLSEELEELRRLSRELSGHGRKIIGSGSRKRAKLALARHHSKIRNRRVDFHWKLGHAMCRQWDVLVAETLNFEEMKQQRGRGRIISDQAPAAFLRKLEWVAKKSGRRIVRAAWYFPSSKICSGCGHKAADMPPKRRVYECAACGLVMDRDENAARNLAQLERGSAPGQSGGKAYLRNADSGAPASTAGPSV